MTDRPVAIITGGSRGIGKAIALELARQQHDVVVNHVRPPDDRLRETQEEIESQGVRCLTVQADVSLESARLSLVEKAKETFDRCDLLVNNAGVAPQKRTDILETTEESYDWVMNVNLKGPFFLTQLVANWMIEQKEQSSDRNFHIVNIGSISAYTSNPSHGEYCISKAGLGMVTSLFADRLADKGILVYEVRPGIIATDMTEPVKDKYDKLIADGVIPAKRWGLPEDVARAVGVIAEGKLDFSTGQVINVDGGFQIRRL